MIFGKLKKAVALPRLLASFRKDWRHFKADEAARGGDRFPSANWGERMPSLWEATATTAYDAHYLYHVAWAVRMVTGYAPSKHVDISSSLNFCTTLSATVPTDFYDFRVTPLQLDNLLCGQADLTRLVFDDASIESLSCMHTIEHVGLGRYGDPIDVSGDMDAAAELCRVVRPGGHLLMVVPVGRARIVFNSHRIYGHDQILEMFPSFDVVETALVRDDRSFVRNPAATEFDAQTYGCGCFHLRKTG
jgi:SAM-dependent methyltransferase